MPKNPTSRATAAEVAERVTRVLQIRLDGAQFHDVAAFAAEHGWNVSERQLWRYIHAADDLLVARQERRRKRLMARAIAMREALAARAINGADYRTALAVLDSTAKLQNLFADGRDLKELAKLAVAQAERLRDLEGRLDAAARHQSPAEGAGPPAGPAGGGPADGGGPAGRLPGGPGPADG